MFTSPAVSAGLCFLKTMQIISANIFLEKRGNYRIQVQLKHNGNTAYFYGTVKPGPDVEAAKAATRRDFKLYELIETEIKPQVDEWISQQ